jgi:cell division septation protein DedD
VYITSAAPEAIVWLSKSDAERLGIEVSLYSDPKVSTKPEPPRAKSKVTQPHGTNLTLGQYVVQVSSQRTEDDANASYKALQEKFAILRKYSPIILRADVGANGVFFRAAVGPFTTDDAASEFCDSLKSDGGQCVVQRHRTRQNLLSSI